MTTKATAKKEAQETIDETIKYTFTLANGNEATVNVPSSLENSDIEVLEALEENKVVTFIKALIGDTQYAELKKLGIKVKDIESFTEGYTELVSGQDPKAS